MNQEPPHSSTELPASVQKGSRAQGDDPRTEVRGLRPDEEALRHAMAPIMQASLLDALNKGSQTIIDSLYPLIGRAVRRSVRESLSALAQSVDNTMRDALTLRQLRWRLEARKQGISVSRLILQKSLLFRVEEAFLIHRETGLLIGHAGARADDSRDLISGMFTAIQDFVADSFGGGERRHAGEQQDQLGRFQVGDQDVWLFHGPIAYLAVVISGSAPDQFREHFHAILEEIHERFPQELAFFEGDTDPLKPAGLLLEDCLIERQRELPETKPRLFWILATILLVGLLGYLWKRWQTGHLHEQVRAYLETQAGVVITQEDRTWRRSEFDVLADPQVLDLNAQLAERFPDQAVSVTIAPYRSLDPKAQRARLEHAVAACLPAPKDPVTVEQSTSGLAVKGEVPHQWMRSFQAVLPTLDVGTVDLRHLADEDLGACVDFSKELAQLRIQFLPNQSKIAPDEGIKWNRLAKGMQALVTRARMAGLPCDFGIYGGVPESITMAATGLCQERTQVAREALMAQGISPDRVEARGWLPSTVVLDGSASHERVDPQSIVVVASFLLSPLEDSE